MKIYLLTHTFQFVSNEHIFELEKSIEIFFMYPVDEYTFADTFWFFSNANVFVVTTFCFYTEKNYWCMCKKNKN